MAITRPAGMTSRNRNGLVSSGSMLLSSISPTSAITCSVMLSSSTGSNLMVIIVVELSTVTALACCTRLLSMGSSFSLPPTVTRSSSTVWLNT